MKIFKVLLGIATLVAIGMGLNQANAVIDGSSYAEQHRVIIFPRLQSADTTETVRVSADLHSIITYFIKIESRHASGDVSSDTVYVKLCGSSDDSTFVNLSSTNATLTYTTEGTNTITFDYLATHPFTHIEIPRMTDSLNVFIKARISSREN
jgi:hypothetical protein